MPEPPPPAPGQPMSPELEKEFRATVELVRAKRIDGRIPEEETGEPGGSWTTRANRDAFLVIEHQRRALAARLHGADRHRRDRYRDLILITMLVRVEYGLLAGRVGRGDRLPPLPKGPPALGKDMPAEWAQAWGVGAMFELSAAFADYSQRRDRLARRLSASTRASAAADAEREMDRICRSGRFEGVTGEWMLDREPERVAAPQSEKRKAKPPAAGAPRERNTTEKGWRRASLMPIGAAAIGAALLAVAGVDGKHSVSGSAPSPTASVSHPPVVPVSVRPRVPLTVIRARAAHRAHLRALANERRRRAAAAAAAAAAARRAARRADHSAATPHTPDSTPAPIPAAPVPAAPVPTSTPPKSTPPKSTPPKSTPPKSTPPKSGPAPAPAPPPAPAPAPRLADKLS